MFFFDGLVYRVKRGLDPRRFHPFRLHPLLSMFKIFHEADMICWRGSLTRIGATPYSDRDPWRFVALRVDQVIYLCEYDENIEK